MHEWNILDDALRILAGIGRRAAQRRRLRSLRGTPAAILGAGHIDSLEMLRLVEPAEIRVIYDVGAHTGTWARLARTVFPNSRIHAFEPLKRHCDVLEGERQAIGNLEIHKVALSHENSTRWMNVTEYSDSSSLLEIGHLALKHYGTRKVGREMASTCRLDDYVREHSLAPPDLIKIDVQGSELDVLTGARDCLMRSKAVLVEVSFVELYAGQSLFSDLVAFLADTGFSLRAFPVGLGGEALVQTDALFLADDLAH
jgi:FkbM family methyltransferase